MTTSSLPLHPNETNDQDITQLIRKATLQLRETLIRLWPNEDLYAFDRRVDSALNRPSITPEIIISCWHGTKEQANDLTINFFYAKLFQRRAINDLEKKNTTEATISLSHLSYYLGFVQGYTRIIENSAHSIKGPVHGGQATKKIRQQVTDHFTDLLSSPPSKGWTSHAEVVDTLTTPLEQFIISNGFGSVIQDTADFILNKLSKKGSSKTAYKSNQHKTAK